MALLFSSARALAGEEEDARAKFEAGQAAYDLGDFDEARRLYAEAYQLRALPGLLFNIGQCHKKLGKWNKAAFFYRRYLARVPEGTDVARLQELIAEMDEKERLAGAPLPSADAEGGKPVSDAPRLAAVLPSPGIATVSGAVPGAAPAPRLTRAVAVAKSEPHPPSPAPIIIIERDEEPLYKQWWFWTGAGVVTAATITAIVSVGVASSRSPREAPKYGKLDAR